MCEIMIAWSEIYQNPDIIVAERDNYHQFDIIAVRSDGHPWSARESKQAWIAEGNDPLLWHNKTALILIPGLDCATVNELVDEQQGELNVRITRRLWHINQGNLNQSLIDKIIALINDKGFLHWDDDLRPNEQNALRNAIVRKDTGATNPNL